MCGNGPYFVFNVLFAVEIYAVLYNGLRYETTNIQPERESTTSKQTLVEYNRVSLVVCTQGIYTMQIDACRQIVSSKSVIARCIECRDDDEMLRKTAWDEDIETTTQKAFGKVMATKVGQICRVAPMNESRCVG